MSDRVNVSLAAKLHSGVRLEAISKPGRPTFQDTLDAVVGRGLRAKKKPRKK